MSEQADASVHHWDVKVYDDGGAERETIRGLTRVQIEVLLQVFKREGVEATAMAYDGEGRYAGLSESVNTGCNR